MSRRTIVTALAGAVLIGGLGAPAMADPLSSHEDDRETICIRTDNGEEAHRKGFCVWIPLPH